MKLLRIFWVFSISILFLKCNQVTIELQGVWELDNSENCRENFLGLIPFIDPYAKYGHKIYVSDSLFYNPSVSVGGLPFERKYKIGGGQIFLEGIGEIEYIRRDSILILVKDGCRLTFKQNKQGEILAINSLSNISFYVSNGDGALLDSVHLERTAFNAHIFRIAESIEKKNLDKIFDEKVLDTNEHEIILQLQNGKSFTIKSYGKYETPFEVQSLLKYLFYEL